MNVFPFNSSRLLAAALVIGAAVALKAQPTPPIPVNTAYIVSFTGTINNQAPEFADYVGRKVSGTIVVGSPNWNTYNSSYESIPEDSTTWISESNVATGVASATLDMAGVFTSTFYTNVVGLVANDNTFVSPYVGRIYADHFEVGAKNWNGYNANSYVTYNGVNYSQPSAFVSIAGLISEFTGKSIFSDPVSFNSITGLALIDNADLSNNLNQFEGRFNFGDPAQSPDFTFTLDSVSVTTSPIAIPEPQTYALALGAVSLAVVGTLKLRRRQTNRA